MKIDEKIKNIFLILFICTICETASEEMPPSQNIAPSEVIWQITPIMYITFVRKKLICLVRRKERIFLLLLKDRPRPIASIIRDVIICTVKDPSVCNTTLEYSLVKAL